MDRAAVFGDSDGRGVTVAIIDSGVERDHPAIGGRVVRSLRVEPAADGPRVVEDPTATDLVGHGTACAGIIHAIAPAADLVSIRVLGPDNRAGGTAFAAALEWAIDQRFGIVNLSLSSRNEAMAERFHELADEAYFANILLVAAANNVVGASYPSLFAAVVSVAATMPAIPTPGSTTRRRRSNSVPTGSMSTSRGAAGPGSVRPATRLPPRTSPAAPP